MERALSQLLVGVMNHAFNEEPVSAMLWAEQGFALMEVRSMGRSMPVADLTRLLSRFNEASADSAEGQDDGQSEASITTRRGVTKAKQGPMSAMTGPEGTEVHVKLVMVA